MRDLQQTTTANRARPKELTTYGFIPTVPRIRLSGHTKLKPYSRVAPHLDLIHSLLNSHKKRLAGRGLPAVRSFPENTSTSALRGCNCSRLLHAAHTILSRLEKKEGSFTPCGCWVYETKLADAARVKQSDESHSCRPTARPL